MAKGIPLAFLTSFAKEEIDREVCLWAFITSGPRTEVYSPDYVRKGGINKFENKTATPFTHI